MQQPLLQEFSATTTGCLDRTVQFMEDRPRCALSRCWAYGNSVRYRKAGNLWWEGWLPSRLHSNPSALAFSTFGNLVGNICRPAYHPQIVLQAGSFNQNYPAAGGYEARVRVANQLGINFQNEKLVFKRIHELQHSITQSSKNEIYPQLNSIIEILIQKVEPSVLKVLRNH